jgi:hypothetical protein
MRRFRLRDGADGDAGDGASVHAGVLETCLLTSMRLPCLSVTSRAADYVFATVEGGLATASPRVTVGVSFIAGFRAHCRTICRAGTLRLAAMATAYGYRVSPHDTPHNTTGSNAHTRVMPIPLRVRHGHHRRASSTA